VSHGHFIEHYVGTVEKPPQKAKWELENLSLWSADLKTRPKTSCKNQTRKIKPYKKSHLWATSTGELTDSHTLSDSLRWCSTRPKSDELEKDEDWQEIRKRRPPSRGSMKQISRKRNASRSGARSCTRERRPDRRIEDLNPGKKNTTRLVSWICRETRANEIRPETDHRATWARTHTRRETLGPKTGTKPGCTGLR
jgi:hypothetical protein